MSDQNQRELAKQLAQQGDPKAIASAINHSLKPKGIIADVMRDNGCLHVMLEGEQVPHHQEALVKFVHNGMKKLDIQSVYSVRVYGRQFGDDLPAWEEEIVLKTPPQDELEGLEEILPPDSELELQPVPPPDLVDQDEDLDEDILPPEEDDIESDPDYVIEEDLLNDEIEEEDYGENIDYNPEEDDDFEDDIEEETVETENKSKILLFVLGLILLTLAALAGLHFAGIYQLPFLSGVASSDSEAETPTSQDSPTPSPSDTTDTPDSSEPTTAPPSPSDPWRDAVNKAQSAANLAQTAQTKAEWETVASEWQQAIEFMQQVPESNPNFETAQNKAIEYENYRQIAEGNAERATF